MAETLGEHGGVVKTAPPTAPPLRRLRWRYEHFGYDGLFDRRRHLSPRWVPLAEVQRILHLYQTAPHRPARPDDITAGRASIIRAEDGERQALTALTGTGGRAEPRNLATDS
jgi:hypothetical protein